MSDRFLANLNITSMSLADIQLARSFVIISDSYKSFIRNILRYVVSRARKRQAQL